MMVEPMWKVLPITVVVACYSPGYSDCEVTCMTTGTCPAGLMCVASHCVSSPSTTCSGDSDARIDDAMVDAIPLPTGPWGNLTRVVTPPPVASDDDPTLTDDLLELYFARLQTTKDLFMVSRATTSVGWTPPAYVANLSTSTNLDAGPDLSNDGLTIYFSSDRPGGVGSSDIYMSTRTTRTTMAWVPPTPVNALNSADLDSAPAISLDGLTIVFASHRGLPANDSADIFIASRPMPTSSWSMPVPMAAINSTSDDNSPHLSSDKLTIYFHSNRSSGYELYQATRPTVLDPFGAPTRITEVSSTTEDDMDPWVSADGRHLFFSRVVGGAHTLFEASR